MRKQTENVGLHGGLAIGNAAHDQANELLRVLPHRVLEELDEQIESTEAATRHAVATVRIVQLNAEILRRLAGGREIGHELGQKRPEQVHKSVAERGNEVVVGVELEGLEEAVQNVAGASKLGVVGADEEGEDARGELKDFAGGELGEGGVEHHCVELQREDHFVGRDRSLDATVADLDRLLEDFGNARLFEQ